MSPETLIEKQLRLQLEDQCARAFLELRRESLRGRDFTLIFADYGDQGACAYKSTLPTSERIEAFELLVTAWRTKRPRAAFGNPSELLDADTLRNIGVTIAPPPGVGFALLVGRGELTSYIASIGRDGLIDMMEQTILPGWRAEQGPG